MKLAISSCENSGIDISSYRRMYGLKYAVDIELLNEGASKLQVSLGRSNDSVIMFEMRLFTLEV